MTDPLPDVEATTIGYLLTHAGTTAIVGTRVYMEVPGNPTYPLVRLIRIGGPPVARGTLDAATVQTECYGTDKSEARLLAATVQAAYADADGYTSGGVFISTASPLSGLQWIPDPDAQQPRYLFDTQIYVRNV